MTPARRKGGPPALSGDAAVLAILAAVRRIPAGWVATYGQVAAVAGLPRRARLVARVLATLPVEAGGPDGVEVPWHRVINAGGRVSFAASRGGSDAWQVALLKAEGVEFDAGGRCDLERFRWPE